MATLVRWEPFRELASIHNEMSRLLNAFEGNGGTTPQNWAPPVDVWETENELVYAFDLPGIPKEDVTIEYEDGMLTVSAKRERTLERSDDRFFRFERRFGTFTRSIGVPQGVDESKINADFRDGVLEVHVAKPEEVKPRRITIGGEEHKTIEGSATKSD
ncbi:MAG TPA: Hsp20/alpha crystallin family protein [Gaiellaceae bacterium]|jgi:HSP20 family protein|nr:Hsp20/alpha crystallin family protein [Gaiellaceae bacterium]